MEDTIRIGKVSSVNGTSVRVTYPDRDNTVTEELPLITNGVYRIPTVGESVAVLHMSNGTTSGFCLGGLAINNKDYLLATLLQRLITIEEQLNQHTNELKSLDERVSALEG